MLSLKCGLDAKVKYGGILYYSGVIGIYPDHLIKGNKETDKTDLLVYCGDIPDSVYAE